MPSPMPPPQDSYLIILVGVNPPGPPTTFPGTAIIPPHAPAKTQLPSVPKQKVLKAAHTPAPPVLPIPKSSAPPNSTPARKRVLDTAVVLATSRATRERVVATPAWFDYLIRRIRYEPPFLNPPASPTKPLWVPADLAHAEAGHPCGRDNF